VWSEICVWPPETGEKAFHQLPIDPWQLKNTVPVPKAASVLTSEDLISSFICSNYSYSFFLLFSLILLFNICGMNNPFFPLK